MKLSTYGSSQIFWKSHDWGDEELHHISPYAILLLARRTGDKWLNFIYICENVGKFWSKHARNKLNRMQGKNCTIRFLETGLPRMYIHVRYKVASFLTPRSFFSKRAVCVSLCLKRHTIQYSVT